MSKVSQETVEVIRHKLHLLGSQDIDVKVIKAIEELHNVLDEYMLGTINSYSTTCTFCGWVDPSDHFHYETPGGAAVCTACAKGLIGDSTLEGEESYQSGEPRLLHKQTGNTLFPKNLKEG